MIFYIDSIDFNTAISVYEDQGMLTKAPDGYYSASGIYRRQVLGKLTSVVDCPITVTSSPVTFSTNEDTNVNVTLIGSSDLANPDYVITSLPNTLQGDIYDFNTSSKITSVPYTLYSFGNTITFKPFLNYYGSVSPFNFNLRSGGFDSNTSTVSGVVIAVAEAPIFDQPAGLFNGVAGDTYTYTGTVSDPDAPSNILTVSVASNSSLPSGWTLVQTPGTNTFTLSGEVPSGADYSIILQVNDLDSPSNVAQQIVSVNAIFATLVSMEFKLNYFATSMTSGGTGSSPKTTSPIVLSNFPTGYGTGHSCNRAQFNLVAGVFANSNGGEWIWKNLGKGSLNNVAEIQQTYNVFDSNIDELALISYIPEGYIIPSSYVDIAAGFQTDLFNYPSKTFVNGDRQTYYNSSNFVENSGYGGNRVSYFDISTIEANDLAVKSNWIGSPNKGIVKFKLIPNSYKSNGIADYHSDSSWVQVFKLNSTGTNQEEVLNPSTNQSFLLSSNVVITVNILNNLVTVGTS
jgi:hypothetical protein